ncbi:MAG: hypothetical protein M3021_03090 [Actinomycetota bacterium]|nr:hypothetical protein [Actinomycetota bacterium]
MTDGKARRTPRIGLPLTEDRALFIQEIRSKPEDYVVLAAFAHAKITAESPESTVASAIFDAGVKSLREEIAALSYAEEAGDPEYQREAAAMRRRPRGHSAGE